MKKKKLYQYALLSFVFCLSMNGSAEQKLPQQKSKFDGWLTPKPNEEFNTVKLKQLDHFEIDTSVFSDLPVIGQTSSSPVIQMPQLAAQLTINEAIIVALQRHPRITQALASMASQNSTIDVAKAAYFPQLSGGISTADLSSKDRGRQLLSLNATQMVYDFGKVKSSVNIEETRLLYEQTQALIEVDDIVYDVVRSIVNINRQIELKKIVNQQINGIGEIYTIAKLRADGGLSSQADPIQAQSYIETAQSNLIDQDNQLRQLQQRLNILLGRDVSAMQWLIPKSLIMQSKLDENIQPNKMATLMAAQLELEIAKHQKVQSQLSRYPTLNIKGTVSQALNGVNPSNNKDNGLDSSVMLEANSNFFQGGAVASQIRAASYAEEAAKANVQNIYQETLQQVRMIQEQIGHKQRQINILDARRLTSIKTKDLYQEQYKLGKRTAVDLLNAEQAIHVANLEIENARYDIYENIVQYIYLTGNNREVYGLNNKSIQGFEIQP